MSTNAYVITSSTVNGNTATIVGTVDTIPSTGPIPVTVQCNYADLQAIYASGGSFLVETFVGALMVQAAITPNPLTPKAPVLSTPNATTLSQVPTGTFISNGISHNISTVTYIGDVTRIIGVVGPNAIGGTNVVTQMRTSRLIYLSTLGVAALQAAIAAQMLQDAYVAGLAQPIVTQVPTGTFSL